jgi:hypothetical protein
VQPEDLFQTRHVLLGLAQVGLKALFELRIARFVDHLGQRLHDLLFGVVDVAQRVHEQVVHRLDVFREEAHDVHPFLVQPRSASLQPRF